MLRVVVGQVAARKLEASLLALLGAKGQAFGAVWLLVCCVLRVDDDDGEHDDDDDDEYANDG